MVRFVRQTLTGLLVAAVLLVALPLVHGKAFISYINDPTTRPGRQVTCIVCEKSFAVWDRGMKSDSQGRTYIAYGSDHLYLAYLDQQGWHLETIDPANMVGANALLDIGPDDQVHIVYRDRLNGTIKYANQSNVGWMIETVTRAGNAVGDLSFVLDSAGVPHISYIDLDTGYLMLVVKVDGTWLTSLVDDQGSPGWGNSLVIDSGNIAHISYIESNYMNVKYAREDGGNWLIEEVTPIENSSLLSTSLALDVDSNPSIAFISGDTELFLGQKGDMGWDIQEIDDDTLDPITCSLEIDQSGFWHLGFSAFEPGENNEALYYAYQDKGNVTVEPVDIESDAGSSMTLSLAGKQLVHMAYTKENELHFATRIYTHWNRRLVDSGRSVSSSHALALDGMDRPHFVFTEYPRKISYAFQDESGYHDEWIATHEGWGFYTSASIVMDQDENPHIAFLDYALGNTLMYAVRRDGTWLVEKVDALVPENSQIAIGVNQEMTPTIAVSSDMVPGVVLYTGKPGGWEKLELDAGEGEWLHVDVDLVVDPENRVHVAYNLPDRGDLRYGVFQEGKWQMEDVKPDPPAAADLDLAVDLDGRPYITYRSGVGNDLYLVRKVGGSWQSEHVSLRGGFDNSIDVASDGSLHVSFRDERGSVVYYLFNDGFGWIENRVAVPESQVSQTRILVGSDGLARISYLDAGLSDLMYLDIVPLEDAYFSYMPVLGQKP